MGGPGRGEGGELVDQGGAVLGKAAVFAGWREMDQYMRENAVVGMPSEPDATGAAPATGEAITDGAKAGRASQKS